MPPRTLTDISTKKQHAGPMPQCIPPRIRRKSPWRGARTAFLRRPPSASGHARSPRIAHRKPSSDLADGSARETRKLRTIDPNLIETRPAPATTHTCLDSTTQAQLSPALADTVGARYNRMGSRLITNQSPDLNVNQQTNAQTQLSSNAAITRSLTPRLLSM